MAPRPRAAPDGDRLGRARTLPTAGADYRAALAADAEAAAALAWARASGDPLAAPLGAVRAGLLADNGRTREAVALLEPLLETSSGDPAVDGQALVAHTYALVHAERMDEALASAEQALAIAPDPMTRASALLSRAIVHSWSDDYEAAVRDSEQVTALARELGPAFLSGALAMEAGARLSAGELDRAAQLNAEAERIGASVDTAILRYSESFHGDLAMRAGRPRDALEHYARSLEAAQAADNQQQLTVDMLSAAHVLADLGEDAEALELAGLAEAQNAEVLGPDTATVPHLPGGDPLVAAEERVGAEAAAGLKARGRNASPGGRVTRACQLAREQ